MRRGEGTTAAPTLTNSTVEPTPIEGCDVCAALVEQRETARKGIGSLTVRECDRELLAHPHRRAGDFK